MTPKAWLKKVAYVGDSELADDGKMYYSKFDDSYITRVGMESDVKFLADREITEELTHGVGFSPKEGKWFGWSHRAIFGFMVGSTCEKGNCHYRPANFDDTVEAAIRFWDDDEFHIGKPTAKVVAPGEIVVTWVYNDKVPNEKLRGTVGSQKSYFDPDNFGRGEWTAKTEEDAKQMAIDFNEGVS